MTRADADTVRGLGVRGAARLVRGSLGLVVRADPRAATGLLLSTLITGIAPVGLAWLTKLLVDAIVDPQRTAARLAMISAGLIGATLAMRLLPEAVRYLQQHLARRVEYVVRDRLFDKVNRFGGLRLFEQPRFHELLQLALDSGQSGPQRLLHVLTTVVQQVIALTGFAGMLFAIHPAVAGLTALAAVPSLVAEVRLGQSRVQLLARIGPAERRRSFFTSLLVQPQAAKELRLFDLGGYFHRRMLREVTGIHRDERALDLRTLRVKGLLGLLAVTAWAVAVLFVVRLAAAGELGAGEVVAFLAAIASVGAGLGALTAGLASGAEVVLGMAHYARLLDLEPDIAVGAGRPAPPLRDAIELEDVWFRYDPDGPWVLRGLTLRIPAGRSLALVGENGSGKSTLVKLLCRLYVPDRGTIRWDGVDLAEFEPTSLRGRIGTVFQDFVRYDLTAAENIGLGDLSRLEAEPEIECAARDAGIHDVVSRLPAGYRTMLSRVYRYGGTHPALPTNVDLSGGQWQKLAVARMLMRRNRDLLVLDEPSSGLDPRAEYHLHRTIHQETLGRTRILVSHRLNAVRDADAIAVLDGGRVVEYGDHATLMACDGRYAGVFRLQRAGYAGSDGTSGVGPQSTVDDRDDALHR